jgi:hypothetical protein
MRSKDKASKLYQDFHGIQPRPRMVRYEAPVEPLVAIGDLVNIEYKPRRGCRAGTHFTHESGDTGTRILKTNLILAVDATGKNFFLLRKNGSRYPVFTERGIIG